MRYHELIQEIETAPMTWLPSILKTAVETCVRKHPFKDRTALLSIVEQFAIAAEIPKPSASCGACCAPNPPSHKTFVVLDEKTPFTEKDYETARKVFKRNPGDGQKS